MRGQPYQTIELANVKSLRIVLFKCDTKQKTMPVILATAIRPPIAIPNSITLQSERFHSFNNFFHFHRELYFRGNAISRKFALWPNRTLNPKTMIDSMRTHVSTRENGVQSFEQEAFIEGTSDSGAVGLEGTLNSLVNCLFAMKVLIRLISVYSMFNLVGC